MARKVELKDATLTLNEYGVITLDYTPSDSRYKKNSLIFDRESHHYNILLEELDAQKALLNLEDEFPKTVRPQSLEEQFTNKHPHHETLAYGKGPVHNELDYITLNTAPFLVITGGKGSGKKSLLKLAAMNSLYRGQEVKVATSTPEAWEIVKESPLNVNNNLTINNAKDVITFVEQSLETRLKQLTKEGYYDYINSSLTPISVILHDVLDEETWGTLRNIDEDDLSRAGVFIIIGESAIKLEELLSFEKEQKGLRKRLKNIIHFGETHSHKFAKLLFGKTVSGQPLYLNNRGRAIVKVNQDFAYNQISFLPRALYSAENNQSI